MKKSKQLIKVGYLIVKTVISFGVIFILVLIPLIVMADPGGLCGDPDADSNNCQLDAPIDNNVYLMVILLLLIWIGIKVKKIKFKEYGKRKKFGIGYQ